LRNGAKRVSFFSLVKVKSSPCDVTIQTKTGKRLGLHKTVLSLFSGYFKSLFNFDVSVLYV